MANDRISIRCSACGAKKLIAKYYPTIIADGWPAPDFADWMYEHMHGPCRPAAKDLQGDPGFTLITDSESSR